MAPPDGVRQSDIATLFLYAYWRFQEIYLSAIWAVGITAVPTFIYWWAQGQRHLPRSRALHHLEHEVIFCVFAFAFLLVLYRYTRPDLHIWRRLQRVASLQGLTLRSQSNGAIVDWIWAGSDDTELRLPANEQLDDEALTCPLPFGFDTAHFFPLLGNRCWILFSAADPSRLLFVTHTPKAVVAGIVTGRGSRTIENVSVMYLGRSESDRIPLEPATHEQLTSLGYKVLQTPDGLRVSKIRANGFGRGQAAMDQVKTDEVIELWHLCSRA